METITPKLTKHVTMFDFISTAGYKASETVDHLRGDDAVITDDAVSINYPKLNQVVVFERRNLFCWATREADIEINAPTPKSIHEEK